MKTLKEIYRPVEEAERKNAEWRKRWIEGGNDKKHTEPNSPKTPMTKKKVEII